MRIGIILDVFLECHREETKLVLEIMQPHADPHIGFVKCWPYINILLPMIRA